MLEGICAGQHCRVTLTDHQDVVLRVLARNVELNLGAHNIRSPQHFFSCHGA